MRQKKVCLIVCLPCLLFSSITYSSPFGINVLYPVKTQDINHLNGYRVAITYQPPSFIGKQIQLYFDAGYSHWWVDDQTIHRQLAIYSIAPYLRIYFFKMKSFSPYAEASIGLSYLTKTRLDNRNLGMHFAFQDQVGLGAAYGQEQKLYTTLAFLHYSNGVFCSNNAGITAPFAFTIGYRF